MYNLKNLDPQHREALDKITEILQSFMDRQEMLPLMISGKQPLERCESIGQAQSERTNNRIIINFIQWVRYFIMGNSPEEVGIKTNHSINRWTWHPLYHNTISIYPWAEETLMIKDDQLVECKSISPVRYISISPRSLVQYVLNLCTPKKPRGLFGLMDGNYGSITLDNAIELMKREMEK